MSDKNILKLSNGKIQITISELDGTRLTPPELAAESILALLSSLDIKEFDNYAIYEKFDKYMEHFLQEIHATCEWAGWKDSK